MLFGMRGFCICVLLLLISVSSSSAQKQLAVTIDDLPFLYGRWLPEGQEQEKFRHILHVLKKHDIKATVFVVGSRVGEQWEPVLDELVADGHTLGNHSFTHPDLNETAVHWYIQDIARCDSVIAPWRDSVRYFRYPYLHRGATAEKYDAVRAYLDKNNYTIVPVTIDNDDWRFNRDYADAMKHHDTSEARSIGAAYLDHMKERTAYFDQIAEVEYQQPVKHILILHMNELNSVYLDELLTWYEQHGWRFITVQEALSDRVYAEPEPYRGTNGISWLLRF